MVRKNYWLIKLNSNKRRSQDNDQIKIDQNQNAKKTKMESLTDNAAIKLLDEKFNETIKTGIELFHNRISMTAMSFRERLAYLKILKKVTSPYPWKLKKVISSKQDMECIVQKAIESEAECQELRTTVEKFIEYKIMSFPGLSRHIKANSLAKHYLSELHSHKITPVDLTLKMHDLIRAIEITEGRNEGQGLRLGQRFKGDTNSKLRKLKNSYKKTCRLCGSKQNLIYSLSHRKEDVTLKEVVEQFCR